MYQEHEEGHERDLAPQESWVSEPSLEVLKRILQIYPRSTRALLLQACEVCIGNCQERILECRLVQTYADKPSPAVSVVVNGYGYPRQVSYGQGWCLQIPRSSRVSPCGDLLK